MRKVSFWISLFNMGNLFQARRKCQIILLQVAVVSLLHFIKKIWIVIVRFLVRSLTESFHSKELSITLKQGVITCITKGNKDKLCLKNWRPISLLNVEYKITSASIAARIKSVLTKLISEDQSHFIPGRLIVDSIRLVYDIMYYTERINIPGMILLLDFATAFDSLSWKFMHTVLELFNFGPNIMQWIKMFYTNSVSNMYTCSV